MSINSTLKKEGIKVISELNTLEINKIASSISEKICSAFPEHSINQSELFISIARLNMYIAEMPASDLAVAKYFYKNNSIYFSKDMDLTNINTLAVHECIHFIQEIKNKRGKLLRLGLYDLENKNSTGMAINEAAVQLMASIATSSSIDNVKYYNMELTTESPLFYPIQTALVKQMIYFTGSYPLFHSTLYSNDIFKNTFIEKSSVKAYSTILYNLDLLVDYEEQLNNISYKLSISSDESSLSQIKKMNNQILALKNIILQKTIETQNIIIENCFNSEFNSIRNLEDIKNFQSKLYNFKDLLINSENYTFFNDFYCQMMSNLDEKRETIKKYGIINNFSLETSLSIIEEETYGFKFFKRLFEKIKLLFEEKLREKNLD